MTVRAHVERQMFKLCEEYEITPKMREDIFRTCYEYQKAINVEREMGVE
jgi:hypothetical protein